VRRISALRFVLATVAGLVGAGGAAAQEPEKVQPGVISLDDRNETFPAIDPVDGSLWFSIYENNFNAQTLMVARTGPDGGWLTAEVAPFSGTHGDRAPRFSQDGSVLVFSSNRPAPGMPEGDQNLWLVWRGENGAWGEPKLLDPPVASPAHDMHSAFSCDGRLWFSSKREGSEETDIWVALHGGPAERVPEPVSGRGHQPDLLVGADGRWIILVVTDPPGGLGGDDLLFTRLDGDMWTAPTLFDGAVNTPEYEYGPTLSPDGRYLYFTSHRDGTADVWRVAVADLRAAGEPLPPIATTCPGRE
jgi:Tol biopolymer transport system component